MTTEQHIDPSTHTLHILKSGLGPDAPQVKTLLLTSLVTQGATSDEDAAAKQREAVKLVEAAQLLQLRCYGAAYSAGWWVDNETGEDVRTWPKKYLNLWIATKLLLTVSEVCEGMEGLRKDQMDDKLPHRKMLEVELADAFIRMGDLAGGLGLDVPGAIVEKLAYNAQRADHKPENRVAAGGKSF